jgi:hypothetical protein
MQLYGMLLTMDGELGDSSHIARVVTVDGVDEQYEFQVNQETFGSIGSVTVLRESPVRAARRFRREHGEFYKPCSLQWVWYGMLHRRAIVQANDHPSV